MTIKSNQEIIIDDPRPQNEREFGFEDGGWMEDHVCSYEEQDLDSAAGGVRRVSDDVSWCRSKDSSFSGQNPSLSVQGQYKIHRFPDKSIIFSVKPHRIPSR